MPFLHSFFDRWVFRHPRSVGETYMEHARVASHYGLAMIAAGAKCLVHAAVPGAFESAASEGIRALYFDLDGRRRVAQFSPEYII